MSQLEGELVRLEAASVAASGKDLLKDISLAVESGDRLAIVGKSGAGKSTLLGTMVAMPEPSEGRVLLLENDLATLSNADLRRIRKRTGHISQGFDLVDDMSALENVLLGDFGRYRIPRIWAWTYGQKSRARADELLEKLGLRDKSDQRAGTLSGGERQRIAIARALMSAPEILFADEPISALDENSSRSVLADLKTISESGVAVVAALHQLELAREWATKIIVLSKGQISASGPAASFELSQLQELIADDQDV